MGGSFDSRVYSAAMSQREIADRWALDVEDSLVENGRSYSGTIGMLGANIASWHDKGFPSEDEAEDWLSGTHQKWEPAMAVSFYRGKAKLVSPTVEKKRKEAAEKLKDEAKTYHKILNYLSTQFRNAKSPYCTCKRCGSKLRRSFVGINIPSAEAIEYSFDPRYYSGPLCPLCLGPLYPPTALNRITSAYKKVDRAKQLKEKALQLQPGEAQKLWLIGGICSS